MADREPRTLSPEDALTLFRRLGVDVQSISRQEFFTEYCRLAWRYHPDVGSQPSNDLMAHINAARAAILATHYRDGNAGPRYAGADSEARAASRH